jgi:hypothetical protein
MFERTAGTPTTPLVTPGTSAIAEKPATGNRQELKGHQQQQECLPLMQKTAVTQATTLTGELWRALGCLYSEARLYIREPERRLFLSRLHYIPQATPLCE